ncbi:permease [Plantibacter sp. CFBP 8798]|uniref:permease n=1 Tax=Plantibacter sp. CFBP 8798 TaxID=2775268 RepID=UPI003F880DBD
MSRTTGTLGVDDDWTAPDDDGAEHWGRTEGRDPRNLRTPLLIGVALLVVVGLFVLRALMPLGEALTPPTAVRDFVTLTLSVVVESLPFVVLGIVLSILVQIWLPDGWLERWLPMQPILRRACISLLGMFLPVCECGNVPLARGLIVRGFTVPESITFLLAAPILNPIVIVTTHQAFGWDGGILVARLVGGFLLANLIGWLFSKHPDPSSLLTPTFQASCEVTEQHGHEHTKVERSLQQFVAEARAIMPALLIGSAVAGAVQVLVPREVLVTLGANPVWSVLAMMTLAVIVSICSNVDAFFVLSFGSTFMPGSIVAFLVLGPVVDVKMLALMRTTYTTRTLVIITAVAVLFSAALGFGVNALA